MQSSMDATFYIENTKGYHVIGPYEHMSKSANLPQL